MERVAGIEPARPAWKAGVLPLNYTRLGNFISSDKKIKMVVGEGFEPSKPEATELQSVGFDRSPTPPSLVLLSLLLLDNRLMVNSNERCLTLIQLFKVENGADCRDRTGDLLITSQLLYQLS